MGSLVPLLQGRLCQGWSPLKYLCSSIFTVSVVRQFGRCTFYSVCCQKLRTGQEWMVIKVGGYCQENPAKRGIITVALAIWQDETGNHVSPST